MRLWSIHPKYLDPKRLTAQWREALLCRAVLEGKTKGYTKHPQFLRVKEHPEAMRFINLFLVEIWNEAVKREYKFDESKLIREKNPNSISPMEVSEDQLEYEFLHLLDKLNEFDAQRMTNLQYFHEEGIFPNDLFIVIPGGIMDFEKNIRKYESL